MKVSSFFILALRRAATRIVEYTAVRAQEVLIDEILNLVLKLIAIIGPVSCPMHVILASCAPIHMDVGLGGLYR